MRSHSWRRACGSRPVVGSSRKSSSGPPTSAQASASRCFCPPESVPTRARALLAELHQRDHLVDRRALMIEAAKQRQRFRDRRACPRAAFPAAGCRAAGAARRSRCFHVRPSTCTSPESGSVRPSQISIVVVLPAPFGPSRPKHSPARHVEVDAVDGDDVLEGLAQLADVKGHGVPIVRRLVRQVTTVRQVRGLASLAIDLARVPVARAVDLPYRRTRRTCRTCHMSDPAYPAARAVAPAFRRSSRSTSRRRGGTAGRI